VAIVGQATTPVVSPLLECANQRRGLASSVVCYADPGHATPDSDAVTGIQPIVLIKRHRVYS